MKMKTNSLSIFLCSLLLSTGITLTSFAGGSIYSRFGVGDLLRHGGSRIDAMGGAGISLIGDGFLNGLNPAGIARISLTSFSAEFEYSSYASIDAYGSGTYARGAFKGLGIGFPISRAYGIALMLEASPYSTVNYATQTGDSLVTQDFYGTGGLSMISVGATYAPLKKLTLGVKMNHVYGRIRQVGNFTFSDPTFLNSEIQRSDYYGGFTFTIGSIFDGFGDLFNAPSLEPLSVGFVLTTPTTLAVDLESVLSTNQSTDTTLTGSAKVNLPVSFGFGLSYLFASRYVVTGDASFMQWQNAQFLGGTIPQLRNSARFGIGFEALPQRETESFLNRIAYRAGIYYNATNYLINGTGINETFLTCGVGVPIGPDTRLNIGLHAGTRGTTTNNLQRDTIFRLSLSISSSEIWFMKVEDE
jgi:hypothetical protein